MKSGHSLKVYTKSTKYLPITTKTTFSQYLWYVYYVQEGITREIRKIIYPGSMPSETVRHISI